MPGTLLELLGTLFEVLGTLFELLGTQFELLGTLVISHHHNPVNPAQVNNISLAQVLNTGLLASQSMNGGQRKLNHQILIGISKLSFQSLLHLHNNMKLALAGCWQQHGSLAIHVQGSRQCRERREDSAVGLQAAL